MRQIVRDIPEIDRCVHGHLDPEVRFLLAIDARGIVTEVRIEQPTTPEARLCIVDALWAWEFASAKGAGELRIVYLSDRRRGT
jgi:hypothetical protein